MQINVLRSILVGLVLLSSATASAQTRDLGARRFILDNGGSFTLTLEAPVLSSSGTFFFPDPSLVSGTFVMTASVNGQSITGPISISSSLATPTLSLSNTGLGAGASIQTTNALSLTDALTVTTTGLGRAGYLEVNNIMNELPTLEVRSNGDVTSSAADFRQTGFGSAVDILITETLNPRTALQAFTLGLGGAAWFASGNPDNNADMLRVTTGGIGRAGFFAVENTLNEVPVIEIETDGDLTSSGIDITHTGLGAGMEVDIMHTSNGRPSLRLHHAGLGMGAWIVATNPLNESDLVSARMDGLGRAGYFEVDNSMNELPALEVRSNGDFTSSGIDVRQTGFGSAVDVLVAEPLNSRTAVNIFHTGLGGGILMSAGNSSNTSDILDVATNGTGNTIIAKHGGSAGSVAVFEVTGGTTDPAVDITALGAAVFVQNGRLRGSYVELSNGGALTPDKMVVLILSDGAGTSPNVTLPGGVENGTILIVSTNDPDGATANGSLAISPNQSRTLVMTSVGWR